MLVKRNDKNNNLIMLNKVLCLLFLFYTNNLCLSYDLPEVKTPLGKVLGIWKTSFCGRKYAAFLGIPYAKPPVGELRFEEPQPVEPWTEVLNATQTYTCLQSSFFNIREAQGTEDCLYLNVYVPIETIDPQKSFDVLVIIHGGAFIFGSGHMFADSKILMDRDLVVVSINYRLGFLGFLSTEDDAIPGNNGMKDQVLALRWVKDNIASFGGNPESITITGLSAGGASVHLHYFSPMSKGLFDRGISQSGTALNPWTIRKNPLEIAKKLAALVACPDIPTSQLKQCLKEKPSQIFIENINQLYFDNKSISVAFAPVIEKGSANPFLDTDPYVLLKQKKVSDLPWITSTSADEGLLFIGPLSTKLQQIEDSWSEIAHYLLLYNYTLPAIRREEVAEKIKEFYLGPGEHINKKNFNKFSQIFTDRLYTIDAEKAAKLQSRLNGSPVYYYYFNYREGGGKMAQLLAADINVEGVVHGEDGIYFYTNLFFPMSESDMKLRNACQDMLYSFAKTGKPSFDGTENWQPTKESQLIYLNVTGPENMELQQIEHLAPSEFWRKLGLLEKENLTFNDKL